jgi:hypothetical protein
VLLCVAVDSGNNVLSSTSPAAGAASWTRVNLGEGYSSLTSVSCPSANACLAVDQGGNALYSSNPPGPPTAWQIGTLTTPGLESVSCPASGGLCAAISNTAVVTSTTGSSATPLTGYGGYMGLTQIACASAHMCVIGDGTGEVFGSTNPSGGASAWSTAELAPPTGCGKYGCSYQSISSVTCPSDTFCAATDGAHFWVSNHPADGTAAWIESALPAGTTAQRLTCPSISLCVVVSGTAAETTTDAADPAPRWTTTSLPAIQIPTTGPLGFPSLGPVPPQISGLSCASTTACMAVDREGGYAFVGNPTSGAWTAAKIDYSRPSPLFGPPSLTDVSCDPSGQCVAVDGLGFAITGRITG